MLWSEPNCILLLLHWPFVRISKEVFYSVWIAWFTNCTFWHLLFKVKLSNFPCTRKEYLFLGMLYIMTDYLLPRTIKTGKVLHENIFQVHLNHQKLDKRQNKKVLGHKILEVMLRQAILGYRAIITCCFLVTHFLRSKA